MNKTHFLIWILFFLFISICGTNLLSITQAKAAQVTLQAKPIAATTNLLLQDETTGQTAITQNIQMFTTLLLSSEDETQQKIFLPIVTR